MDDKEFSNVAPLDLVILDLLRKKDGSLKDNELFEMLKTMIKDISYSKLNKALMKLELRGKINVSSLKKERLITLKSKEA
ncbi:MAG: hypothetical protein NO475_05525 [Candidatus Methanomethylicia archaeon]|jgi:Fe2+ or Zn2+ uptake regulation protein|uniref:ArsR family transcriptional regulator n=1 Tax=Thermoproteota archaeon TaxID=2056631 RepID=A0A523BB29_9CREN|nr:hypothetical protein [Candidatus Methanomethylicia archaeon]MCQ5341080.1 hypothetical protein [Candidatus Methanomethylicia archaeon]RZN55814.1 MAG: hypothetical protein EF809_04540 [Candidatus Verstraetearchaeota archaeon]TDA38159.1 MAG: hypothetical protein DSO09_05090 [Candidatus Verstraetearchaeota archaeon]